MSTFTSITFPFSEAVAAFNAVAPHSADKREVTPIITGVHITPEGSLVATDRYTVGCYKPAYESNDFFRPRLEGDDFQGATLPPEAVKWVTAMRATKLAMGARAESQYGVRLVFNSDAQTVKLALIRGIVWQNYDDHEDAENSVEQQAQFDLLKGNFPPVERLFPNDGTKFGAGSPLSLNMNLLARIGVATKWLDARGSGCARFQFTVTDNPNKPGPVYVTVGDRLQALVQPNLLLR